MTPFTGTETLTPSDATPFDVMFADEPDCGLRLDTLFAVPLAHPSPCLCGNADTRRAGLFVVCDACGDWWPVTDEMGSEGML